MSERIELWATVRNGCVHAYYRDPDFAARVRRPDEQIVHLVELRDGEPHPDETAKTIAALTERAEKAEATVRAREMEIDYLRNILKQFEDGGMSGRELREAKADERAWFERECAMRFRAAYLTHGDGDFSELEEARKLADHFWGTK